MQGVERLALVCKVLFDARLLELCRENETLKLQQQHKTDALQLQVFWLQHDDLKLKQHLAWANDCATGPSCCCAGCYWNGRFDYADEPRTVETDINCTFVSWFETQIEPFGLTSSPGHAHAVTTHFAMDEDGQIDFARWFLHTPTCAHPDLRKVHDLFAYFARISGQVAQPGQWDGFWHVL
jgi:hypothetical protein